MFGIKAGGLQNPLHRGIARMDFGRDATDAALARILQERADEAGADPFIAPHLLNEQFDAVHRLASKLRSPFIGCISVRADALPVLRHDDDSGVGVLQDVLENLSRFLRRNVPAHFKEEFGGKRANAADVVHRGRTNDE